MHDINMFRNALENWHQMEKIGEKLLNSMEGFENATLN